MDLSNKDELLKRLMFIPCDSKEALHRWIRVYLGINLPDCIVAEESNSSPMDLIWELYNKARLNNDENFSRVMAYASRGSFKTLGASILEILTVLHLKRNVGHMAATKDQSERSQEYVRELAERPYIKDFKIGENKKRLDIVRYTHKETQLSLTEAEYISLPESDKRNYERISTFIQIVICSLQGANGLHSEVFCVDGDTDVTVPNTKAGRARKTVKIRSLWSQAEGAGNGGRKSERILENKEIINP
jgi:hypothetical protein